MEKFLNSPKLQQLNGNNTNKTKKKSIWWKIHRL